jgi:hypothetical protein
MLRFSQFLINEAYLSNYGDSAEAHASKHITPYIGSAEPTHSTKEGQRVFVHGHEQINGIYHAKVSTSKKGKKTLVPFSQIIKPKTGYSDEHAIVNLWNHSIPTKIHGSVEQMHSEIAKAEKDASHPLSFENAAREGFLSKDKTATGAREAYYSQLKNAAHTVHSIAQHPDVQQSIKTGDYTAQRTGAQRGILSSLYSQSGVREKSPGATSKTDITIGTQTPLSLTIKNSQSSQISSSGSSDFISIMKHAANKLKEQGHIDDAQHNDIMSSASAISELQKVGTQNFTDRMHQNNINAGNQKIKELMQRHPKLNAAFRREALTGEGKFDSKIHVPSHIVTHGPGSTIKGVNEHDYEGSLPRMSLGKGGSGKRREYAIRVDAQ